ncbi:L-aspartate oxidase [bacterium]|nr:L-aspartate oxidase [bacterium]
MEIKTDFLVIGSGLAGLSFALKVAPYGRVALVTKRDLLESNTSHAQGGIAAVFSKEDSYDLHIQDTLRCGCGLCRKETVELVVKNGPARVRELAKWGVDFSLSEENKNEFDLGLEGGHSRRRILHIADITGKEIVTHLAEAVKKKKNIAIYEEFIALNLILNPEKKRGRCWGAYVLDKKKGVIHTFLARIVVLATGGSGKVYLYTSNSDVATGDGIAMAYQAGAKITHMEFMQFHPTCLYHLQAKSFLISEALRGEGGILRLSNGTAFMKKYHPLRELAPRDIVARAIDQEMKERGEDSVFLDITHRKPSFIKRRFPNIYQRCLSLGIDITKESIPVVPAAHYLCGGVVTDRYGRTNIKRLYAIGEVACTGLHGANRLASNSLLEDLVFAHQAAEKAKEEIKRKELFPTISPWDIGGAVDSEEAVIVAHNWDEVRHLMWNYVGIVRSNKRLERARRRIRLIQKEIRQYYWNFIITSDLVELRNIALVAGFIIDAALRRRESRGLHYNLDYPPGKKMGLTTSK